MGFPSECCMFKGQLFWDVQHSATGRLPHLGDVNNRELYEIVRAGDPVHGGHIRQPVSALPDAVTHLSDELDILVADIANKNHHICK